MSEEVCTMCRRPLSTCREPVDKRFPPEAREAFERKGYDTAATCPKGQQRDMARVGWCWDRARRSSEWRGMPVPEAERRGVGFRLSGRTP